MNKHGSSFREAGGCIVGELNGNLARAFIVVNLIVDKL